MARPPPPPSGPLSRPSPWPRSFTPSCPPRIVPRSEGTQPTLLGHHPGSRSGPPPRSSSRHPSLSACDQRSRWPCPAPSELRTQHVPQLHPSYRQLPKSPLPHLLVPYVPQKQNRKNCIRGVRRVLVNSPKCISRVKSELICSPKDKLVCLWQTTLSFRAPITRAL